VARENVAERGHHTENGFALFFQKESEERLDNAGIPRTRIKKKGPRLLFS